jgi:hypothetical protein
MDTYFTARTEFEKLEKQGGDRAAQLADPRIVVRNGEPTAEAKAVADALRPQLGVLINEWHASTFGANMVISDKIAEHIINRALMQSGYATRHDAGSHKVGADVHLTDVSGKTEDGLGISVKTGTVVKAAKLSESDKLTISGSRTGKYKTLEEKINFLTDTSPNVYTCISRERGVSDTSISDGKNFHYTVYVFSGDLINYGKPEDWDVESKTNAHINSEYFKAEIRATMSDQVWTEMRTDAPGVIAISIPVRRG